jgi:hypothetical protein
LNPVTLCLFGVWTRIKSIPCRTTIPRPSGEESHSIPEAERLASLYTALGAVPVGFYTDALHIAMTTVYGLDYIVSLNFQHIVREWTIGGIKPMKTIQEYMDDPAIAGEPRALREIHAARLKIQDERKGMTAREFAQAAKEDAMAISEKYGFPIIWADLTPVTPEPVYNNQMDMVTK